MQGIRNHENKQKKTENHEKSPHEQSVDTYERPSAEEQTIENNMETLSLLYGEFWDKLSADEKLALLQTVADIEQNYLGLPYRLNVGVEELSGGLSGCYSDVDHSITVNRDHLLYDSAKSLINTIAHESYHSLQFRILDVYENASEESKSLIIFSPAVKYKDEFSNYIEGDEDYEAYYSQQCEADARNYARNETTRYFESVYYYLAQ